MAYLSQQVEHEVVLDGARSCVSDAGRRPRAAASAEVHSPRGGGERGGGGVF